MVLATVRAAQGPGGALRVKILAQNTALLVAVIGRQVSAEVALGPGGAQRVTILAQYTALLVAALGQPDVAEAAPTTT